jgi:hypothetical protein
LVLFKCGANHPEIELADSAVKAGNVHPISGEQNFGAGVEHFQANACFRSDDPILVCEGLAQQRQALGSNACDQVRGARIGRIFMEELLQGWQCVCCGRAKGVNGGERLMSWVGKRAKLDVNERLFAQQFEELQLESKDH